MSNVTVEEIGAFTAEVFGLPEAALTHPAVRLRAGAKGPSDVPVGQALNIAAWLARRHTSASFPAIASAFGRRDHSSLVTGAAGIAAALASDAALRAVVDRIEDLIDACHEARLVVVHVHHHPSNDSRVGACAGAASANGNPALAALVVAAIDHARKASA